MSRARIDLPALKQELRSMRTRMQAAVGPEQMRLLAEVERLRERVALAERRRREKVLSLDRKLLLREEHEVEELAVADGHIVEEAAEPPVDPDAAMDDSALDPQEEEAS